MDNPTALGSSVKHYLASNDLKGRCPTCYASNTDKVGVLTVDGTPRDVAKCHSCNGLFSAPDGAVRSLVEEAQSLFDTKNVGFVATVSDGSSLSSSNGSIGIDPGINRGVEDKLQNQLYKLDSMNNNLNATNSNIQHMQYAIEDLVKAINDMATQNKDLMNKLMTDPLNGIRKSISDFNLE